MKRFEQVDRRLFITQLGRATFGVAVLGLAACSSDADPTTTGALAPVTTGAMPTTGAVDTTAAAETTVPVETTEAAPQTTADAIGTEFARVNLGFVSAYVLARSGEAAVVDTGVDGSAPAVEAALRELGLGWNAVGSVILTHLHDDHIGSVGDVMTSADAAMGYAGAADLPQIPSPRPLDPVGDGDVVFGLDIIETPGHTPGSISVHDAGAGILVAGDALNVDVAGVTGANPDFSSDMAQADESVKKLAGLQFDTLLVGHGEPVIGGASEQVAALADTL